MRAVPLTVSGTAEFERIQRGPLVGGAADAGGGNWFPLCEASSGCLGLTLTGSQSPGFGAVTESGLKGRMGHRLAGSTCAGGVNTMSNTNDIAHAAASPIIFSVTPLRSEGGDTPAAVIG
jgi:hypothetical protein